MIARWTAGTTPQGRVLLAILLMVALIAPFFASDYLLTVLILILYFAYTGQAWNIMMGFAGQLSLGHALYAGLGGYIAAGLYFHYGIGPSQGSALDTWLRRIKERPSVAQTFSEFEAAKEGMANAAQRLASGQMRRDYRDHRLEWMIKSGGVQVVLDGLANHNIRFSWP